MDAKDYAAGVELYATCREVPLCELLDALWSLLSNADASYRWYREGKRDAYRYTFYEPDALKRRAERIQQIAAEAYVNYVNILCEMAAMSPEQRRQNKDMLKRALIDADEQEVERSERRDPLDRDVAVLRTGTARQSWRHSLR